MPGSWAWRGRLRGVGLFHATNTTKPGSSGGRGRHEQALGGGRRPIHAGPSVGRDESFEPRVAGPRRRPRNEPFGARRRPGAGPPGIRARHPAREPETKRYARAGSWSIIRIQGGGVGIGRGAIGTPLRMVARQASLWS